MTITRAQVSKQVKTPPKPTKKPKVTKSPKAMVDSANRMSEMESKADAALKKATKYKCGGKVKGKK
jgi:hypothetical protein